MENLKNVQSELKKDSGRAKLVNHDVLKYLKEGELTKEQVAVLIGQWYYPLANFPFFLSSCIAHIKETSIQTFLSDILHEELGCGDPAQSHLKLYETTMADAGFSMNQIVDVGAFPTTVDLINGYKTAAKKQNDAIGFVYATEVADLAMVSSIGYSVAKISGKTLKELPWADIHIKQEPNHVNNVNNSTDMPLSKEDSTEILESAQNAWRLWALFFEEIGAKINIPFKSIENMEMSDTAVS